MRKKYYFYRREVKITNQEEIIYGKGLVSNLVLQNIQ